jgi:hypothetical protein
MEAYVRERWESVQCKQHERFHPAKDGTWVDYMISANGLPHVACAGTAAEAWAAAYAFTVEREEEIREREEEIALIIREIGDLEDGALDFEKAGLANERVPTEFRQEAEVFKRILTRLQLALADLKRGMKPAARS